MYMPHFLIMYLCIYIAVFLAKKKKFIIYVCVYISLIDRIASVILIISIIYIYGYDCIHKVYLVNFLNSVLFRIISNNACGNVSIPKYCFFELLLYREAILIFINR